MFYDAVQLDAETVNDGVNALAAWVSLQNMRFPLAAMQGSRRRVKFIENLITGERHILEWGGVRLRIDQQQDPALLFRCFT
jgi:starch synthase (maltosyl-transferring)